jgi:hypothetical protein
MPDIIKYKICIYIVIYYIMMLFVRFKLIILLNNTQICCKTYLLHITLDYLVLHDI